MEKFTDGKLLFCDLGKRSILYLMASNNVIKEKDKTLNPHSKINNFGV